jgi:transglutaminase-like putative cysteine protease
MYYSIRHVTRFRFSSPIRENVMEARVQPRTEGYQHCLEFRLISNPRAQITSYRDYLDNIVHHFDIPGEHTQLTLTAEALVELQPFPVLPGALSLDAWAELDRLAQQGDYWEMLQPSHFTQPSGLLQELAVELNLNRKTDPLTSLVELNQAVYKAFEYVPQSTRVDSPIDEAVIKRRGVCQDFTHIMIALVRRLGIPCRYISGYLFHRHEDHDRSAQDATHAWLEAFLPELGWVGFDPTNNLIAAERHIRVAIGRDYADVPPTRGVFKGKATDELSVGVRVSLADAPRVEPAEDPPLADLWPAAAAEAEAAQWQQQQ